jgi:hypothetical protein
MTNQHSKQFTTYYTKSQKNTCLAKVGCYAQRKLELKNQLFTAGFLREVICGLPAVITVLVVLSIKSLSLAACGICGLPTVISVLGCHIIKFPCLTAYGLFYLRAIANVNLHVSQIKNPARRGRNGNFMRSLADYCEMDQ